MYSSKQLIQLLIGLVFGTVICPSLVQAEEVSMRGPIPFSVYDQDGNGFINLEEFTNVRNERRASRTRRGKSSQGMSLQGVSSKSLFADFDSNSDGQLDQVELSKGQSQQREKRRDRKMSNSPGKNSGMNRGRMKPSFADYDLNNDGKLLEAEFKEAHGKRVAKRVQQGYRMKNLIKAPSFSQIDSNGDGEISAEEFTEHQRQRQQEKEQ